MNPLFIHGLGEHVERLNEAIVDDALHELELFVSDYGPRIVAATEADIAFALDKYAAALELEKQRPLTPETLERIAGLEKAVKLMEKFPGTMHIGLDGLTVKISYDDEVLANSLNFGTREVPKLEPSMRAVSLLIREAAKQGIKLEREHFVY
jgi:hypothetical protein